MDCFGGRRKKRNNNGNGNQSRNQKPDSNENFFESQAAEFVPNMGVELDKEIVEKKRDNVNEPKTPDSNEGFFESQAAKFVSKMGMELDKEIVEVTLNMEEFPGGEQIMQDANKNRVVTKEGIRVNRVDFGTYFHGFGLRKNDVIFLLNGQPIISEASVNMNLLRIINSSFNSKLYMKLFRAVAMSSVVNTERPEPSVLNLIAESSMVNAESSVVNAERPEPSSVLNLIAESSMVNAESSVVNTERPEPSVLNLIAESSMVNAESSVVNAERSTVDETVMLDNKGNDLWIAIELLETVQWRIQSTSFKENGTVFYLTIESANNGSADSIVLREPPENIEKLNFTMRKYAASSSKDGEIAYVTLQHRDTEKFIWMSQNENQTQYSLSTTFMSPECVQLPNDSTTTTFCDKRYLFKVIKPGTNCNGSYSPDAETFQPMMQPNNVNSTTAIGFDSTSDNASLLSVCSQKTHFIISTLPLLSVNTATVIS